MTGRERILSVLRGEIPDRVPVCPFVQQEYLSYYFGRNDTDRIVDAVRLAKVLDFDVFTRDTYHIEPHYTRRSYPNWEVEKRQYVEGGIAHRVLTITTPGGVLTQREVAPYDPATISGIHFSTKEYLLSDLEKGFLIFKKYMPQPGYDYAEDMKNHAAWAQAVVGDQGLNCPWGTGGVYNTASTLRSVEDLMCDPYDDEELYGEFMTFLTDILVSDYEKMCDTDYAILGLQGNIANAGMLSCDFFTRYVMPYEERVLKTVKERGKFTLYHNCGLARRLYPAYEQMHMTLFETLSPAPQGDNSMAEAKATLGKTKVLAGNLDQIRFLKTASLQQVENATRELVEMAKAGGRYIFAASDYLEKDTPLENVKAMLRAAKDAGQY